MLGPGAKKSVGFLAIAANGVLRVVGGAGLPRPLNPNELLLLPVELLPVGRGPGEKNPVDSREPLIGLLAALLCPVEL